MTEERIANYNDHAKFMADIAINILNRKKLCLFCAAGGRSDG